MKKRYRYVLVIIISIVLIFLSIIFLKHKPIFIENVIKDSGMFLNQIIAFSINDNNENIMCEEVNKELENQINELKDTLNINNILSDYENINSVVISHDIGYWYDSIIINKGKNEGIEKGMAVINSKGLLGKVVSVSNFNSTVQLLTSEDTSKISVKIEQDGKYIYGLINSFKKENNVYIIDGISDDIKVGSKVTTTGFGGIFPAGIMVGEVINSKSDIYDLAKTIEIKPSVDYNNINIVSVLKRKV